MSCYTNPDSFVGSWNTLSEFNYDTSDCSGEGTSDEEVDEEVEEEEEVVDFEEALSEALSEALTSEG